MSLAASGYNPYWAGGMPLGVDPAYMAPYGGPMPFMGYAPGPFEVPFTGGMLPQDPFAAQAFMMPPVPRCAIDNQKLDVMVTNIHLLWCNKQ